METFKAVCEVIAIGSVTLIVASMAMILVGTVAVTVYRELKG